MNTDVVNESEMMVSPPSKTDWFSVMVLVIGIAAYATAHGASYPLTLLLLASRGASDVVASLGATFFLAGLGVAILIRPRLTKGMSAKTVMVFGLLGMAAIFVVFAIVDNFYVWFLLRFIQGIFVNAMIVNAQAWLNVSAAENVRGRVSSCYGAAMTLGFAVGPMLVPVFGIENGRAFLVCAALVTSVSITFALLLGRAKAEPKTYRLSDLPRFAKAEPFLILLVFIWGFAETQVFALAPLHMTTYGVSVGTAATFVAVISLGMFLCQPVVGFLLDVLNRWLVAAHCLMLSGVMFGLLLVVPVTSWWLWPIAAIGGGGLSCTYTCALSITGSRHSGSMLVAGTSTYTLLYAIGGVAGPPISGLSNTLMPGTIFLPVALSALFGAVTVLYLHWTKLLSLRS